MTAINFPNNPQVGDTFLNFAWDGEKWRNAGSRANAVVLKDLFEFSVAADDSTQRTISTGESIKFIGAGTVTTASDAEGNITITGVGTTSYNDLTDKPTIPSLTGYATETFVTTRGYLTTVGTISYTDLSNKPTLVTSYTQLTDTPSLAGTYTFNVAADDSTLREIGSEETIKFVGAGGITTASDAEGTITITQGVAAAGTLTGTTLNSTVVTSSLTSLGTLSGLTVGGTGGDLTMTGGAITGVGNITAAGILAVNASGGITTTQTSFDIVNSTATTVNLGGAATAVNIGATTGTLTLNNPTVVGTQTTATLFNTTATTVSAFGAATTATIGATSGTLTLRNPTVVGTQTTVNLWNTTSTTVNAFGAATAIAIGAATGTTTVNNGLTSSGAVSITNNTNSSSVTTGALKVSGGAGISGNVFVGGTLTSGGSLDVTGSITVSANITASNLLANASNAVIFNTTATTIGIGGVATTLNLGASTGTATINNPTVVGHSSNTTVNLWNTVATTINFAGAATILNLGASSGTTTVNNNLSMASGKTIGTTGTITSNHTTAFIAGDNAASNIGLQLPSEAAIRNLTNGSTNMYFDVSIGGSTQGQFQFRSSSSYTNVLTMSSTGVTFNTDATVTSRTPSVSRTAYNAAIDSEITLDSMRFRVSNQGGIFPQVIGNGSSRNLAWTSVGAVNGSAINQVGSTGTIVADNAWTTLYNLHGMDSAGDTVTVTLQDKAAGRIYRITFMRSDNGSTTGYNIIGERLV